MKRGNIFSADVEYDGDDPPGYRSGVIQVGKSAGGEEIAVKAYELPAGESLCPYHYEYVEEWLIVLEGTVDVRVPGKTETLTRGETVRFDVGPSGAHKVTNSSDATARILMFSSSREPSVAVYPDSGKMGVWTGNPDDKVILRRSDGNVDYWDGEA